MFTPLKKFLWPTALLAFCFLLRAATAADPAFTLPPETAKLKAGPGYELATAQCMLCHSADYISTQPRLTAGQWRATVVKMQTKYGAPILTDRIDDLADYFARNYGGDATTNSPTSGK